MAADDALRIVFQHLRHSQLLCVPSIARDPEHHWVLANRPSYIVHYAIEKCAKGPDELVRRLWHRLKLSSLSQIVRGAIEKGNLAMVEYVYQNSQLPYDAYLDGYGLDEKTLLWAAKQKQPQIVNFFLNRGPWNGWDSRVLLEECVRNDWMDIALRIVRTPGISFTNAFRLCIDYKRRHFLKLFLEIARPSQELFDQIAISGDIRAYRIVMHLPQNPTLQTRILAEAVHHGHVRLYKLMWKSMNSDLRTRSLQIMSDQNPIEYSCWAGYFRMLKVLERDMPQFKSKADLSAAAQNGNFKIVSHLLRTRTWSQNELIEAFQRSYPIRVRLQSEWVAHVDFYRAFQLLLDNITSQNLNVYYDSLIYFLERILWLQKNLSSECATSVSCIKKLCMLILEKIDAEKNDWRQNNFRLAFLAMRVHDDRIEALVCQRGGHLTADEYECNLMHNEVDDGSVATSAIQLAWNETSDSDLD